MKIIPKILLSLAVTFTIFSLAGCGSQRVPQLNEVLDYSFDELQAFAEKVNEDRLIKKWGEPYIVNGRRIWTVQLDGGSKYVTAWVEDGKVTSMDVSCGLYVTVARIEGSAVYGTVDYNDHSTDAGNLTSLPHKDCFGNEISYSVGDKYYFEFDGMIMETYPAKINDPFSVELTGHLSDDEIERLQESIVLP